MICLDLQPLSMVEDSGFRSLMSEAEPRFVIPARKSLRNNIIHTLYASATAKVKDNIAEHKQKYGTNALYSITTDGWTSNNTTSYIAYTLHIIENFKLVSYVINLASLKAHGAQLARSLI